MDKKMMTLKEAVLGRIDGITCPICNNISDNFYILKNVTARIPVNTNDQQCEGDIYPAIECICDKCGYIMAFSQDVLGIQKV